MNTRDDPANQNSDMPSPAAGFLSAAGGATLRLLGKMRGAGTCPERASKSEVFWSFAGALVGIAAVGLLHERMFAPHALSLLIGSFGASAVLLYGAPCSPLAQPRNLLGGHVLSALIGVTTRLAIPDPGWLCAAMAVAAAIACMHLTGTLHPPGGATALIAVIGGPSVANLGFLYVLVPAGTGATVMLLVALLANNLAPARRYPVYWW